MSAAGLTRLHLDVPVAEPARDIIERAAEAAG
jgi:hypothetical protein